MHSHTIKITKKEFKYLTIGLKLIAIILMKSVKRINKLNYMTCTKFNISNKTKNILGIDCVSIINVLSICKQWL